MTVSVSCILPAWNEAARIGAVLSVATGHPALAEVIVVDDGSTDETAAIAQGFAGVRLIRQPANAGKTRAMVAGIMAASGSHLLFLDSDLQGLTGADIHALIAPVASGRAAASVSLRGNAPRPWHWLGIDYISGERVLARASLPKDLGFLLALPRFGFEVALNRIWLERGEPIAVVPWPGVRSPLKAEKAGWRAGVAGDLAMIRDIVQTVGLREVLRQIVGLRRLSRLSPAFQS